MNELDVLTAQAMRDEHGAKIIERIKEEFPESEHGIDYSCIRNLLIDVVEYAAGTTVYIVVEDGGTIR